MAITFLAAVALLSQAPDSNPRLLRMPHVNGENVVFTYAGDLWLAKLGGGVARRLTSSNGQEQNAKISPDGKHVAFTGTYDGNADVYVIPIEGGEPKRLTFDPEGDVVLNWTPDGKIAYASTAGNFTNRQQRLWLVDPKGGISDRTAIAEVAQASYFPDGKRIAYNRQNSANFNWRRYRGGSQGKISFYDFEKNQYSELPAGREQNHFPMVAKGDVFFISDKNQGTLNLYRHDPESKRTTQLTQFADADIRWPSTDGETIVYERDGLLYAYDIDTAKISPIAPTINSENLWARPYLRSVGNQISGMSLSPSGVRLAVEARGEIFSLPAKDGDTRNFTGTSGVRERMPEWSPDGKHIAYISDATGHYEVYMRPQMGGEAVQLTTNAKIPIQNMEWSPDGKKILITSSANELWILDVETKKLTSVLKINYGLGGVDWSPDSKYLAFTDAGANMFGALKIYDLATGKTTQINEGRYDDGAVAWDRNGKYLYFVSTREFSPSFGQYEFSLKVEDSQRVYVIPLQKSDGNPLIADGDEEGAKASAAAPGGPGGPPASSTDVKIDWEGLGDRAVPLPWPTGNYQALVGVNNGVLAYSSGTLLKFDLGTREPSTIITGLGGSFAFNANRTKMAYNMGGTVGILDVRPGVQIGQGRVSTSDVQLIVDPRAEWKQMFWEVHRYMRDNFYDPNMMGVNWDAIGKRYAEYLPYVNHRSDLSYVFGMMIGELGTGHAYVQGGDFGPGPTPIAVGNLGADYEVSGNYVRFKKIYRGVNYDQSRRGPLGEPGVDVKEGEYLLEIDGQKVDRNTHPASLMLNKAGRHVTLTVNSTPSLTGARKVRVRTLATEGNLRYVDFVEENRRKVEQASGGRIGYMHIPNTAFEGAVELIRGFYSQTDKEAVIVDERWNGGGYIQPWFVDTLARKKRSWIQPRHGNDWYDAVAIEGPKAMLINGYAGSGGDFFPYMFRQSKLGPLIGTRTWGGLVGISGGVPLVDGGSVTAPSFALYNPETNTIIAENTGIDPDVEVDLRPDLWAKGQDPQLEAAIKHLMDQLAKTPKRQPRTTVPKIDSKGRVGGN